MTAVPVGALFINCLTYLLLLLLLQQQQQQQQQTHLSFRSVWRTKHAPLWRLLLLLLLLLVVVLLLQ